MASTAPQDFPSLDKISGVPFIAVLFAAGLWGITTAQAYWYYTAYPKDPTVLKLLVGRIWTVKSHLHSRTVDTVHQALISFMVYHYVITNYFNPRALNEVHPTAWITVLLEILATFLVQSFFLKRIWHLSNRQLILVVLPAVFNFGRLVVGLVLVAQAVSQTNLAYLNSHSRRLSEWGHGLAMGSDILLASLMVYLLHRSRTGLRQTNDLINRLMLYAVNTGAVTALFSIGALVCLIAFPNTFIFTIFYYAIGRLYANSMLASLNARKDLRNQTPPFMEASVATALGGHSQGPTSQSRADVSKQTIPGGAFERSSKRDNAFQGSGKMGVCINTTRSASQDPVYIGKIERDSEPVHVVV